MMSDADAATTPLGKYGGLQFAQDTHWQQLQSYLAQRVDGFIEVEDI